MDLDGLRRLLHALREGRVRSVAVENAAPSVFCHEILNASPYAFLDDAPLEERRARAVQLRSALRTDGSQEAGILDASAIEQVNSEVWPEPRDADELHDALLTLVSAAATEPWCGWFAELVASGRAFTMERGQKEFWVATERREAVRDILLTVRGWMEHVGPVTSNELAGRLALPGEDVHMALAALEGEGQVFCGHYRARSGGESEWCNRRILARIHRLTLGRLRREIEPVPAAMFHQFLARWQHVAAGTQLHGADGLLQIVKQLQGYEIPAAAWETEILGRRIAGYTAEHLDELCLSGEVVWARLSPHAALSDPLRSVRPSRIAPISLFLREDAGTLVSGPCEPTNLSQAARGVHEALVRQGASFFTDLVRASGRPAAEVEDALWELTTAGLVTADGFENLRTLVDPKRRAAAKRRHSAGRWALVSRPGETMAIEARTRWIAEQLLLRWGVLFRDLLARETIAPPWRDLLVVLRRMEAQGEIRGGRFVAGFTGEQFARPEAVDLLRAVRRGEARESIDVAPADPLNLTGIILPGARVSMLSLSKAG
jgi:ATP-dependent Lhr-like helicase